MGRITRESESNKMITIIRYKTIKELFEAEYNLPWSELKKCQHGGVDGEGNEYEFDFLQIVESVKKEKCYGFVGDKKDIHIWVDKNCKPINVIRLMAHERGHLIRPYHRDLIKEEIKAELFSLCAEFAFLTMNDILDNVVEMKEVKDG